MSDSSRPAIEIAARLAAALGDHYTLERELGAGGMATVYLAHDIKHDRPVAVKVLRPELAAVIGAERFLAEIKTTANLQHPHILPLFDSGEADSFLYYVMPYVEGISLRDRMTREKQLPIAEAVRIATEISGALDYAHRRGVIHRDIKPENIMLHDGSALVADFGIALAASKAGTRMTETGMSLGTPQYMSPEQAMGERELDARSDVYALGCVTYEMLTGEPPFTGPTAQAIVAKVMTAEPTEATQLRRTIPAAVSDAVHTALQKLPADRFASAADFAAALNGGPTGPHTTSRSSRASASRSSTWRDRALVICGILLALAAGWFVRGTRVAKTDSTPVEFAFRMGDGGRDRDFLAISPDGRRVIRAVADSSGINQVEMRDLGSTAVTLLAGADGANDPVFSPDGEWILFARNGQVLKMPATGGPTTLIVDSASVGGATFSLDGKSVFFTRSNQGVATVAVAGGKYTLVTHLDTARKEFNHWYPQMLPGDKALIFTAYATPIARSRIEAVELATGRRTVLVEGAVFGQYVPSGHLLYARDGAVFAIRFDPATLRVSGTAVPVLNDVAMAPTDGMASLAVAPNGTLVYTKASEWAVERRVIWVDRSGNESPVLPAAGSWAQPRLSPNGRWIGLTQTVPQRELWLYDRSRQVLSQLTHAQSAAFNLIWLPDSKSFIYTLEDPVYDLHRATIDASRPDTEVLATPYDKRAESISPDGRTLIYSETVDRDILMAVPLSGGTPTAIDLRPAAQRNGMISPDGKWLVYEESDRTKAEKADVFVRAVDGHVGRLQVSAEGGNQPRWTKGGREIVFRKGDAMLASTFDPGSGAIGTPVLLFRKRDAGQIDHRAAGYDVTPDGSRFLLIVPEARPEAQPIHVILNWLGELKRKVP